MGIYHPVKITDATTAVGARSDECKHVLLPLSWELLILNDEHGHAWVTVGASVRTPDGTPVPSGVKGGDKMCRMAA
jgi:hypothetical protein